MVQTWSEFQQALKAPGTRIEVGSKTFDDSPGNSGIVEGCNELTGEYANSRGLPNEGWHLFKSTLVEMIRLAHEAGKELWVNLAGFTPFECAAMAYEALFLGADGVVLNFACPNKWSGALRQPMAAQNPELAAQILMAVRTKLKDLPPKASNKIAVKISPIRDEILLQVLCNTIAASKIVTWVIASNTVADQDVLLEDSSHALAFTTPGDPTVKHVGGASGSPHLDLGVWMVAIVRKFLPEHIKVIGCLGISTGDDALRYIDAGADGWQCAAACRRFGFKVLGHIMERLVELLEARDISN